MKRSKGFTLIELLIMMAIIAILIGIAMPPFVRMQKEAEKYKQQAEQTTNDSRFSHDETQQSAVSDQKEEPMFKANYTCDQCGKKVIFDINITQEK